MSAKPNKKAEQEASARDIARRLAELPRPRALDSEAEWIRQAGVSGSFFSNIRGNAKKPPSEPSITNLRLVLQAVGSSLPEFFLHEGRTKLSHRPSRQELEQAFQEALSDLPPKPGRRAVYLAQVVEQLLGLPEDRAEQRDVA